MGILYKRGNIWWIKYLREGKPYRETSRSRKKTDAERLLRLREGTIVQGTFRGLEVERTTVEELLKGVASEYQIVVPIIFWGKESVSFHQ